MWLNLLCNSPFAAYSLGCHEVWIRASPFLKTAKELILINFLNTMYCSLFHYTSLSVCLGLWYWSHHLRNLLEPSTCSDPVQSLYISLPATYSAIFACRLLTYSLIVQIPVVSNSASTEANSHSLLSPFLFVVPEICLAILWWNPYITVIIASVIPQIYIPYRSTTRTNALYILSHTLISAPVFPSTFSTILHKLYYLCRFL